MGWIERQEGLQERVEDCIDELADELGVEINTYPQAYKIYKNSRWEDFWLCEKHKEMFEHTVAGGGGACWVDPYVVWIRSMEEDVEEEAAHALNFYLSGIKNYNGFENLLFGKILAETCGFLGSKIINPSRQNRFLIEQDIFEMEPKKIVNFLDEEFSIGVHQQGYCLGEVLYAEYNSGRFSKRRLKNLFSANFEKDGSARKAFDRLRKEYWPFP